MKQNFGLKYLSTTMATNWPKKESWKARIIRKILFFIPVANPDYDPKMYLVNRWLVEFTEEEEGAFLPWREIAIDINGEIVFAGPDKRNYGFWLDTNMKFDDFTGELITKEEFERFWKISGVEELK